MNNQVSLYRKRFIPNETNHLKDDRIVYMDDSIIITKVRECYEIDRRKYSGTA